VARVDVPLTQITRAGIAPAAEVTGDAVNNHTVNNDGAVFLLAHNTGATTRVLTIHLPQTVDGQAVASRTVSLAAGVSRYVGPFPVSEYGEDVLVDVAHAELVLSAYHL
jgi:hypothetical protein